jgi:hypothetical protein
MAMGGEQQRPLVYFVQWQRGPATEKAELLGSWGYDVRYDYQYDADELSSAINRLLALKADAIVLSIDAFPGYTRSFALGLKAKSGLAKIPRIVVGSAPAELEQMKQRLPGASFSDWDGLPAALTAALGKEPPPADAQPQPDVRAFLQG